MQGRSQQRFATSSHTEFATRLFFVTGLLSENAGRSEGAASGPPISREGRQGLQSKLFAVNGEVEPHENRFDFFGRRKRHDFFIGEFDHNHKGDLTSSGALQKAVYSSVDAPPSASGF
jgi:hypothetical protein